MAQAEPRPRSWLELEIPRQGDALRRALAAFVDPVEVVLAQAAARGTDDWVVTGCGDSLFAGRCGEVWFAQRAGLRLRALDAMTLSRYLHPSLGVTSTVFAVSHSGTTARVLEAARAARASGAFVVAVTANADSALAELADLWIDNAVHGERSNTRTASFQAVCALMHELADGLGAKPARALPGLAHLADAVEAYVEPARRSVDALDGELLAGDHWLFTGAGTGHATALYGMAKLYEAATVPAHASELEQLIHCEIFPVRPGSVVVLLCPLGHSTSRARELAEGLARLGATTIAVTNDEQLGAACTATIPLPVHMPEDQLPFFAAVPLQWLALRIALARGEDPDLVGNKSVNRPLIDHSAQWDDDAYSGAVRSAS